MGDETTSIGFVLAAFTQHPERMAIRHSRGEWTYGELIDRVYRMARVLRAQGLGRGDVVTLLTGNHADTIVLRYAANVLGCCVSVLYDGLASSTLADILRRTSASALAFAPDRYADQVLGILDEVPNVANNQPDKCRESLDQEYTALQAANPDQPTALWWYFYNESFYWDTATRCALKLHRPEDALSAIDKSLTLVDPAHLRQRIFRLLLRAEVRIQQEEIPEASSIVVDVTRLTAVNASQLIVQRISEVRSLLTPWARTKPVRKLDERLAAYGPAGGKGNGSAKRR